MTLNQRSRFPALDGIRGFAAIFVLMRHTPDLWTIHFFRTYLAVDVFFVLSGFVLTHAYEKKIASGTMPFMLFFKTRIIRIYPVFLLSVAASGIAWLANKQAPEELPALLIATCFFIPIADKNGWSLYPLNGPYWSIFYELISNFSYAIFHRFISDKVLPIIVAFFAACCALLSIKMGGLDAGNLRNYGHLLSGFCRANYGFFLGVLIYRSLPNIENHLPKAHAATPFLLILILFITPSLPQINALIDIIAITIVIPLAIAIGSVTTLKKHTTMEYLGASSYPMYLLHVPPFTIASSLIFPLPFQHYTGPAFLLIVFVFCVTLENKIDVPIRKKLLTNLKKNS